MSYGLTLTNTSNIVTISDNARGYVYMGKYGPFTSAGEFSVDVTCAGFPMVFLSAPHNFTDGDGGAPGWGVYDGPHIRSGSLVRRIQHMGGSTWRVFVMVCNASWWKVAGSGSGTAAPISTTLRVFGRLDLNYPAGIGGNPYGMRVWDASGALVFDSNGRMLRLAGNTYDTELALSKGYPGFANGNPRSDYNAYDTSVALPFSMVNKSICVSSRSYARHYEATRADYFDGSWEYSYATYDWATAFWSSGSTLYARKVPAGIGSETFPYTVGATNTAADSFTRVAVIDNSLFP